jgi:hypothetical protein
MSMQVGIKLANLDTALYVFHELQLYFIGMKCQRCKEIDGNLGIVFGALVEDFSLFLLISWLLLVSSYELE